MIDTIESLNSGENQEFSKLDVTKRPDYDPDSFEWKSAIFSHPEGYPSRFGEYGDYGQEIDDQYIDKEMQHEDWPTLEQMKRVANQKTSLAVSSYGLRVYRAFQDEEGMTIVMLDERVFGPVNLQEVMAEAANIAMDEGKTEDALPFLKGVVAAAYSGNFPVNYILPYQETFFRTGRNDMISLYVETVCKNTVKGPNESWQRLKSLGNSLKILPLSDKSYIAKSKDETFTPLQKQLLLEEIGHDWIRKSMPLSEIDFLT